LLFWCKRIIADTAIFKTNQGVLNYSCTALARG